MLIANRGDHCCVQFFKHSRREPKGRSMPKGPQGQKRPADVIGCAIMVAKVATGELEEELQEPSGKTRSEKAWGKVRVAKLTKAKRSAIAKKAVAMRWGK